jgi:hypothetical protein
MFDEEPGVLCNPNWRHHATQRVVNRAQAHFLSKGRLIDQQYDDKQQPFDASFECTLDHQPLR